MGSCNGCSSGLLSIEPPARVHFCVEKQQMQRQCLQQSVLKMWAGAAWIGMGWHSRLCSIVVHLLLRQTEGLFWNADF